MNKYILLVLLFATLSVYSLSNPGLPPTHDGEYHVLRFAQFYKVISEGNIYPRWAPDFNNGFGIPLFNFVYPLPNYMASFFHFLGFSFIDSFKLNMGLATLVGAVLFYIWSRKYWGDLGGAVSSVFYTFSPYHFLDIYVRGSVGEVWALAIFPGLLWSFYSFYKTTKKKYFLFSVIFLFLLVLSHNILALVFFTFFILYFLFLLLETENKFLLLKHSALIIVLGFFLSAPFWLPAFFETKFVVGLKTSLPWDHFPKIYQLIYSSWGYGFSGEDASGQMSFQIGIANLIVVLGGVLLFFKTRNKELLFFLSMFAFSLFLITPFSLWLWKIIPFASFIQFPWRLLSVLILISSFLAGSLAQDKLYKNRKAQIVTSLLLILLSVVLGIRYAKAPFHHLRNDWYYLTKPNFTDGTNSPGNAFNTVWLDRSMKKTKSRLYAESKETKIEILENKSSFLRANIETNKKEKILVNIAYFPGWNVYIKNLPAGGQGKKSNIKITDNGLFEFKIPKGNSKIEVKFEDTFVRKFSWILSLVGLFFLIGLFIWAKSFRIKK